MNKYKIVMSENFDKELENIYYYIKYILLEPNIAKKLYNKILNKIFSLEYFPEGYPKLFPNIQNIRKLFVNNYLIVYYVDNQKRFVNILHIYHSKQNYLNKF